MIISDVLDLVEISKLQGLVLINRRPNVLAVIRVFDLFKLPHAAHVGQPRLYIRQIGHLDGSGEGVPALPEEPPTGERVAVIRKVGVVLRPDVDGYDVVCTLPQHLVSFIARREKQKRQSVNRQNSWINNVVAVAL